MSIYAKIVGPFKGDQGPYMGYITMTGSLASIVSPLWATYFLDKENYSGNFTFFSTGCLLLWGLACVMLTWKFLVPHPDEQRAKVMVQDNSYGALNDEEDTKPLNSIN